MSIPIIQKENISNIEFATQEVLKNKLDIDQRTRRLNKALSLGNIYKNHVRITFMTSSGKPFNTIATVWAVTSKYVVLKSHMMIPIRAITEVDLVA